MSYNYFQQTLVPSTSAWSIGTVNNPFKDIWLSFGSLNLSNKTTGVTGIAVNNNNNYLTLGAGAAGIQIQDPSYNTNFQITSASQFTMYTPTAVAGQYGAFNILGSSSRITQPVTSNGVMMHVTGNDGVNNRIVFDSYGAGAFTQLIGRAARGTALTPTNSLSGDTILRITANGYNQLSGFVIPNGSLFAPTTIEAIATESFSGSSVGTEWRIYNATKGDTSATKTLDLVINEKGITVPVASAGITFGDNSFQNTAFNAVSGTWTPQLSAATPGTGFGYTAATTGNYYKTGKTVYATFAVALSSKDSTSGNVYLTNLPFPINNGAGVWGDLRVYRFVNLNNKATIVTGGNEGSAAAFTLYYTDNTGGGSTVNLTVADLTSTSQLYGAISYIDSV
jgi:hypothetical protein